jgi:hypothetical protein
MALMVSFPCVNKYRTMHSRQCVTTGGGGGLGYEECIYWSSTLCILPDSKFTKLLHHPKENPTPAAKYLNWSIFKKSRH